MMLEWLGQAEGAVAIRQAVEAVLSQGVGTPDLGGNLRTEQMADLVIQHLER
jgi:isocitrate/isopropylmalate dehydrogenase